MKEMERRIKQEVSEVVKRTYTNYLNEKFGDLESAAQWQSTFSEELDAKISNSANIQSTLISNMNNLNQRLMEFESCIVDREGGIANKIASSNPIVEQSIESLTSKVMENEQGINDVEAYWRRQNMIVAGVPLLIFLIVMLNTIILIGTNSIFYRW